MPKSASPDTHEPNLCSSRAVNAKRHDSASRQYNAKHRDSAQRQDDDAKMSQISQVTG
jgi:hypothetical protein